MYMLEKYSIESKDDIQMIPSTSKRDSPVTSTVQEDIIAVKKEGESHSNIQKESCKTCASSSDELKNIMLRSEKSINKLFKHVFTELDTIKNQISSIKKTQSNVNGPWRTLPKFPIKEKLVFTKMDSQLMGNEEMAQELTIFFNGTGGDCVSHFVRHNLKKLLTDEVAHMFTWHGTNEKSSFRLTFTATLLKGACYTRFPQTDEKVVDGAIRVHFLYANDRIRKRVRGKNKT